MIRALIGLVLFLGPPADAEVLDTYPKNPNIDAINYAFDILLSDSSDEILYRIWLIADDGESIRKVEIT